MNEYQKLVMYLKILQSNLAVLHHNIVGSGWFEAHGVIGGYESEIAGMTDDLIERGIALGYKEPTIAESVLAFQTDVLPADKRERDESYRIVMEAFRSAGGLMQAAEPIVPDDVMNKLQEMEYWLNKEANYKLAGALGKGDPDYDD